MPVVLQFVKSLIEDYYNLIETRKPDRFERVEEIIKNKLSKEFQTCVKKISNVLKSDVSWRFTFIDGKNHNEIYKYQKGDNEREILGGNLKILKENSEDLFDLINYRWGLILETFNSSPRINRKVKIMQYRKRKK